LASYYTVESVRAQLLMCEADPKYAPLHFPKDWEFCPCIQQENGSCRGRCIARLGVFIDNPLLGRFPLDITYIASRQRGFIPTNNAKLTQLINGNIVSAAALVTEIF
jgi:hypothetical protein